MNPKEFPEDKFGEDAMPCPCEECGEWFDLDDGESHPRNNNVVICADCANRLEKVVEREEEIEDLLSQKSDAEWTVNHCNERLKELNYKPEENGITN